MNGLKLATAALGLVSALSLSAALAGRALAAEPTASQILSEFNLVTTGDVTTSQDVEGSAAIGGNLNGATFFNADVPASPAVDLFGALGAGPLNLDNGGNLFYAGAVTAGQVNFNGGGQHYTVLPDALSAYTAPLATLSATLETLSATPGAAVVNGAFSANGATGLVVFNLTAAQLANLLQNQQITFSGGPGVTGFIVNVSGNFTEPSGVNFNTAQQDALFNFYNATSVQLGNWKASVLAPDASLSILNGYIAGSVYAASFAGGGELHNDNLYDGALPGVADGALAGGVPEPSTWLLMLLGFAGLGYAGYRGRGAAKAS